jgi:hypothetical protein
MRSFQFCNFVSFFFFVSTGVWTQGLMFAIRHPYCLRHSAKPFLCWVSSTYGLENYLLRLALNLDPPDQLGLQVGATSTWFPFCTFFWFLWPDFLLPLDLCRVLLYIDSSGFPLTLSLLKDHPPLDFRMWQMCSAQSWWRPLFFKAQSPFSILATELLNQKLWGRVLDCFTSPLGDSDVWGLLVCR